MAEDKELSQLETVTNPSANDLMYIVSGGNARKIPYGSAFPKDDYYTKTQMDTALAGKEPTISVTANRALVSDANGKVSASSATATEVGYLSGVTGAIQTQINGKADENEATPVSVSGNPITITDAANIPCESLSMTIEPIQSGSGTPSPTNARPITGLTEANAVTHGRNIYNKNASGQRPNERISTGNGGSYASSGNTVSYFIDVEPNTVYTLTTVAGHTSFYYFYREGGGGSGGSWPSGASIITGPTTKQVRFDFPTASIDSVQFEKGQQATAYEPYTANNVTIDFGETVYGGNVDFDSGVVRVEWAGVNITSGITRANDHFFYKTISNAMSYGFTTKKVICDKFPTENVTNKDRVITDHQAQLQFYTVDAFASVADFMTAYGDIQVVYKLATPTTLTLTPAQLTLLKGYNTVSANGATINLDYQKDNLAGDIKKWVLQQIQG